MDAEKLIGIEEIQQNWRTKKKFSLVVDTNFQLEDFLTFQNYSSFTEKSHFQVLLVLPNISKADLPFILGSKKAAEPNQIPIKEKLIRSVLARLSSEVSSKNYYITPYYSEMTSMGMILFFGVQRNQGKLGLSTKDLSWIASCSVCGASQFEPFYQSIDKKSTEPQQIIECKINQKCRCSYSFYFYEF